MPHGRRPRDAVGAGEGRPTDAPESYACQIKAGGHTSPDRLRKQLPEPVFGQIKQARGFRQFLLRGLEKVRAEWLLFCTALSSPGPISSSTSDEPMRQRRTLSIRRSGIGSPQRSSKHLARQSRVRGRDLCDDARPEDRRPEGYDIRRARAPIASEENSSIRTP
jgi:hypothetical protein